MKEKLLQTDKRLYDLLYIIAASIAQAYYNRPYGIIFI